LAAADQGRYLYWRNGDAVFRWDHSTGKVIAVEAAECCSLAVDAAGSRVAVGGNERVLVLDGKMSKAVGVFRLEDPSYQLAMPDSHTVMAYSSSGVLTRMDLDAGSVGARRLIRNPDASLVTFSPNGQRLSIAQPDGSVQVCAWTGLQCFTLVPGGASVSAVSFSVGGRFVAVARGDGTLGLWEVSERRPRLSIDAGRQSLVSVDEESGVMALLADDGEVRYGT
jgi:WD40 repeat protein